MLKLPLFSLFDILNSQTKITPKSTQKYQTQNHRVKQHYPNFLTTPSKTLQVNQVGKSTSALSQRESHATSRGRQIHPKCANSPATTYTQHQPSLQKGSPIPASICPGVPVFIYSRIECIQHCTGLCCAMIYKINDDDDDLLSKSMNSHNYKQSSASAPPRLAP